MSVFFHFSQINFDNCNAYFFKQILPSWIFRAHVSRESLKSKVALNWIQNYFFLSRFVANLGDLYWFAWIYFGCKLIQAHAAMSFHNLNWLHLPCSLTGRNWRLTFAIGFCRTIFLTSHFLFGECFKMSKSVELGYQRVLYIHGAGLIAGIVSYRACLADPSVPDRQVLQVLLGNKGSFLTTSIS